MRRPRAPVAVTVLLLLTACSDGDEAEQAAPTTAAPDTTAASATSEFCQRIEGSDGGFDEIAPVGGDPERLEEDLSRATTAMEDAEAVAPPEIKEDVGVLAGAFDGFRTALEGADYDVTQVPISELSRLDSPEVQAAAERLDAYRAEHCGG